LVAFHVEHIVAKQHGGSDDPAGLALACDRCNGHKGPNLTTIDPESGGLVSLFHPRKDSWEDHFALRDGYVYGVTPVGRATVRLLNMNAPRRVELRRAMETTGG
jgi:5-methylcytosine-specific restriction endonuclease McrA